LDFVVLAIQPPPDSPHGRQMVAYPFPAARLIRVADGRRQIVIDLDDDSEHTIIDGDSYRDALIALADDPTPLPGDVP
jgi:hypothetical protein